jgi:hypothetical protein
VDDNRLGEELHSGGRSRNYRSSNLFTIVTMVTNVRLGLLGHCFMELVILRNMRARNGLLI